MKAIDLACGIVLALAIIPAIGSADPTRRAERLETLVIDAETGFSVTQYELQAGIYYRWRIATDGRDDYTVTATGLFSESWIDKITIDDTTLRVSGLNSLTFEEESQSEIWFVPLRAGTYRFAVEGLAALGFAGEVIVK
ncbi:hypothetical protein [Primorskyibacter sp. 2E233]|uniref:hypothetical protein n=1 Tax=Primorskyibacter sp. 2E233 TaxID=3413431 RepID=UPI003BF304BB